MTIVNAISNLEFSCSAKLDRFISEHCHLFMLHCLQARYLLPMAEYFVIAIASNFGIRFCFPVPRNLILRCLLMEANTPTIP